MNRTKSDKLRVGMLIGVSLAVIITAVIGLFFAGALDNVFIASVTFIVVGISVVFIVYAARTLFRDINKGLPFQDERSKRVMEKAGSNSFIVMIYLLLALGLYTEHSTVTLLPSDITGIAILGGSVSFFAFWVFFHKRANLN